MLLNPLVEKTFIRINYSKSAYTATVTALYLIHTIREGTKERLLGAACVREAAPTRASTSAKDPIHEADHINHKTPPTLAMT